MSAFLWVAALSWLTSPAIRRIDRHAARIQRLMANSTAAHGEDPMARMAWRLRVLELERMHEVLKGRLD